jgi:hypothetical protein
MSDCGNAILDYNLHDALKRLTRIERRSRKYKKIYEECEEDFKVLNECLNRLVLKKC